MNASPCTMVQRNVIAHSVHIPFVISQTAMIYNNDNNNNNNNSNDSTRKKKKKRRRRRER